MARNTMTIKIDASEAIREVEEIERRALALSVHGRGYRLRLVAMAASFFVSGLSLGYLLAGVL